MVPSSVKLKPILVKTAASAAKTPLIRFA